MLHNIRLNRRLVIFIVLTLLVSVALYLSTHPDLFLRVKQDNVTEEVQLEFTVEETCIERWLCSSWSTCSPAGISKRVCVDVNSCGTPKPEETAFCSYIPTPGKMIDLKLELPEEYAETELGSDVLVFTTISMLSSANPAGTISHTILDPEGNVVLNRIFPLTINESIVFSDLFSMEGSVLTGEYTVTAMLDVNGIRHEATETFSVIAKEAPLIKPSKDLYILLALVVVIALVLTLLHQIKAGRVRLRLRRSREKEALDLIKETLGHLEKNNLDKAHESAKDITNRYRLLSREEKRRLHKDYRKLAAEMKHFTEALKSYKTSHDETTRLREMIYSTTKKELQKIKKKKRKRN